MKYGGEKFEIGPKNRHILVDWVRPNSRVLELGSASGYITKYLNRNLGCRVTSVELDKDMANHGREFAEKMIIANLDKDDWLSEVEGSFDYIIMSDVLEHLRNPKNTLRNALRFLKQDGEVLLSIPNIAHSAIFFSLADGDFTYRELGLLDNTHIHFFTWKTFSRMLEGLGMRLVKGKPKFKAPGCTELNKFIITHLFIAPTVIFRRDAFTYQFFTKWQKEDILRDSNKIRRRPNIFLFIKLLLEDFAYFFYLNLYLKHRKK